MISIQALATKFDSRGIAGLSGISLSIKEAEVMALMGPNGSGKTTLLKMISKELTPQSGVCKVEGKISTFPSFTLTEDSNVQRFLISKVTTVMEEEKKLQLARDLADTFEFTFQLRQKISELSSGQRQKILLAAELINRPDILLMDEPFNHLDPLTRQEILKNLFIHIRQQGMTVLWVTHDLEDALRFSSSIGIMNFGKLEQLEAPINLMKNPENLFVAQFIGYRNFLTVTFDQDKWITPWGPWNNSSLGPHEAIMVIPDYAWKNAREPSVAMTVQSFTVGIQCVEYRLKFNNRIFHMKRPILSPLLEANTSVSLTPVWDQCFLLKL